MMTVSGGSTRAAEPGKFEAAANENGAGLRPSRRTLRKVSLRGSTTTSSSYPLQLSPRSWRQLFFLCWMSVCLSTFILLHDDDRCLRAGAIFGFKSGSKGKSKSKSKRKGKGKGGKWTSLFSRKKDGAKDGVLPEGDKKELSRLVDTIDEFQLSARAREEIVESMKAAQVATSSAEANKHLEKAKDVLREKISHEDKTSKDYREVQDELGDLEKELEKKESGETDKTKELHSGEVGAEKAEALRKKLEQLQKELDSWEEEFERATKSQTESKKERKSEKERKPRKKRKSRKRKSRKKSKRKSKSFLQMGGRRQSEQDGAVGREIAVSSKPDKLGGPSTSHSKAAGTSFLSLRESTEPAVHGPHHHHHHHHHHSNSPGDRHKSHNNLSPENKNDGTGALGHAEGVKDSTNPTEEISDSTADSGHQTKTLRISYPPKSHEHTTHEATKPRQDDAKSSKNSAQNEEAVEHTLPESSIEHHKMTATSTAHKQGERKHDGHADPTTKDGSHSGGERHDKPAARKHEIHADRPERLLKHLSSNGDDLNSMFSDALKGMAALEATNQRVDGLRHEVQKDVELLRLAVNKQKENALEMEKLEEAQRKIVDDQLQYLGLEELPRSPPPRPTSNANSHKDNGAAPAGALSSVEKAAEAQSTEGSGASHTLSWTCLWAAGFASVLGGALP